MTIDVTAVNHAPTSADNTVTTNEDTAYAFAATDFAFTDVDTGDTLQSVTVATLPGAGALTLSGATVTAGQSVPAGDLGNLIFTPAANANGASYASFTFRVGDGEAESGEAYTMTIDVTAVNDAPTLAIGLEDQRAIIGVAFSYQFPENAFTDVDNANLTYSAAQSDGSVLPTWLSFDAHDRKFSGTPAAADTGVLTVKVTASDTVLTAQDAFTITVGEPLTVTLSVEPEAVSEGAGATTVSVTATLENATRSDATPLTVSVAADTATAGTDFTDVGDLALSIPANASSATVTFTFTPTQDTTDEPDETVTVSATSTVSNLGITETTLRLTDDDNAPRVILHLGANTIEEADDADTTEVQENRTTVTATLSHPSSAETTIAVTSIDDVVTANGTITIAEGATSSEDMATVTAIDNEVPVPQPVLVGATAQNTLGVQDVEPVQLTINDNDGPAPGTLRLENGTVAHEGRLEMFYGGDWGTVCDDYWDHDNSMVACQQMGYENGSDGSVLRRAFFGRGTGPIHLDDVLCKGTEARLVDCPRVRNRRVGYNNCSHGEDVGVRCVPDRPTIPGAPTLSDAPGTDGRWGPGETLRITLTFSEAVNVTTDGGSPDLEVRFGDTVKDRAQYVEGSGTTQVVFAYTLDADDGTHASVHATGDSLALNGGFIRSTATEQDAQLDHMGGSLAGTPSAIPALTAEFSNVPESHRGPHYPFTFHLTFSHEIKMSYVNVRDDLLSIRAEVTKARRLVQGSNIGWEITVKPISDDDIVITLPATEDCAADDAVCTAGGEKLTHGISTIVPGLPAASIADSRVHEGPGATLEFYVTLSRPVTKDDAVRYRTVDGTAKAGEDYQGKSGYIFFDTGVTTRFVSIPVNDDAIDEGEESMTVELFQFSNGGSYNIRIEDGVGVGTIVNTDPMPKAWLARFGRTVGEQVVDTVTRRLGTAPDPGLQINVAGRSFGSTDAANEEWEKSEAELALRAQRQTEMDGEHVSGPEPKSMAAREALAGASFAFSGGSAESGLASLWAGSTVSSFEGRQDDLTLDGRVTSTMLGGDYDTERTTAGIILSHSEGQGSYLADAVGGEISSTLTGMYPYARYRLTDRVSLWSVVGYGAGVLTLKPEDRDPVDADIGLALAALGARGELLTLGNGSDLGLTMKSDGLVVRTRSERVPEMAGAQALVSRLRLGLEATRSIEFEGGSALTTSAEIGIRHDAGDAETGFGVDVGGGLAWRHDPLGINAGLRARGLLTHESKGFRETGVSGSLGWDPAADYRGPMLSLRHSVGAASTGGAEALFAQGAQSRLQPVETGTEAERPGHLLEAKLGYGIGFLGSRWTAVPNVGYTLNDSTREVRLGTRLVEPMRGSLTNLGVDFAVTRRENTSDNAADHGVVLGLYVRVRTTHAPEWRRATANNLGLRVEFSRRESRSAEPEHAVQAELQARW
ncbi:MAG: putative Ig domain-containing protein [Immundisolibacterales bacterium]|nr:putative Ig domain-containing protein [Immundisolibacterales bacterium]